MSLRDTWFFHFFSWVRWFCPPLLRYANHHEYKMRHLDTSSFRVAAIQPSHQFLRTRARTICMHRHPDADNRYGNHVPVDRPTPLVLYGWCPYTRPLRKVIRRPTARVNSDEKSRRNTRAGNWLDDYTIPARDLKIFNSAQLLEKKVRQRVFLTRKYYMYRHGNTLRLENIDFTEVFTMSEGRRKASEMPIAWKDLAQQFAKMRLHNYQLP